MRQTQIFELCLEIPGIILTSVIAPQKQARIMNYALIQRPEFFEDCLMDRFKGGKAITDQPQRANRESRHYSDL